MVFPQGQFSPESGPALKFNGFVAAVNTEVAPTRGATNATTIADLWNIAIMKIRDIPDLYASLPSSRNRELRI